MRAPATAQRAIGRYRPLPGAHMFCCRRRCATVQGLLRRRCRGGHSCHQRQGATGGNGSGGDGEPRMLNTAALGVLRLCRLGKCEPHAQGVPRPRVHRPRMDLKKDVPVWPVLTSSRGDGHMCVSLVCHAPVTVGTAAHRLLRQRRQRRLQRRQHRPDVPVDRTERPVHRRGVPLHRHRRHVHDVVQARRVHPRSSTTPAVW